MTSRDGNERCKLRSDIERCSYSTFRCSFYSPDLDYQDVKLKIVHQEGLDAHDFNLFDDPSSKRKPISMSDQL